MADLPPNNGAPEVIPQATNMSLRDYFAAQMAAAYVVRGSSLGDHIPELAYKMADKLLLERKKQK